MATPTARSLRTADLLAVLDHLPGFVAQWDRDLRNVFANRLAKDWFGLCREEMVGRHLRDVIGAQSFDERREAIEGALSGVEQHLVRELVDAGGTRRLIELTFVPRLIDGEPDGFFALATDITARAADECALRRQATDLAVAEDRARIATELNALVTRHLYAVVLELSASLQPGLPDPQRRVRDAIGHIEESIRDLRSWLALAADPDAPPR